MEEAAAAELPPQATPPKTPDAMPGSNGPPAVPPEVQAIIAQDSLSRQGTPSRERKELWELLNLPEGESFSGGWHKLLEATRSSKVIRSAMDQNRANDDILMEMVQTCLESIAENTFFVSTAKKTFAAHEKMLEEIPNLRAEMVRRAPGRGLFGERSRRAPTDQAGLFLRRRRCRRAATRPRPRWSPQPASSWPRQRPAGAGATGRPRQVGAPFSLHAAYSDLRSDRAIVVSHRLPSGPFRGLALLRIRCRRCV